MRTLLALCALGATSLALPALVGAQGPSDPEQGGQDEPSAEQLVEEGRAAMRALEGADPFTRAEDDPLGADAAEEQLLRTAPLPDPEDVVARPVPVQEGQALTAIAGVRETQHDVNFELVSGLVIAHVEQRFTSTARHYAEVRYRLAVPEGAALVALEVCGPAGCRSASVESRTGPLSAYDDAARARGEAPAALPIGHAVAVRDARGAAIVVRAAPVVGARIEHGTESTVTRPARDLVVRTTWALAAPVRGGALRLVLPARGSDARIAAASVTVRATDVVAPEVNGVAFERRALSAEPDVETLLTARVPSTAGVALSADIFPCAAERCVRARAVGRRPRLAPVDLVLAIDASPSTAHSARGRIAPAAWTLLRELPEGSRVRVLAFAARVQELSSWVNPDTITERMLREAVDADLGSATHLAPLWATIEADLSQAPALRVVIVGDGGLTTSTRNAQALAQMRARGVTLSTLSVADREVTAALAEAVGASGGVSVHAGREAQDANRGRGDAALIERITTILASASAEPVTLHEGRRVATLQALREGEEVSLTQPLRGRAALVWGTQRIAPRPAAPALADALWALQVPRTLVAIAAEDAAREEAGSCRATGHFTSASAVVPRAEALAMAHLRRCDDASDAGGMLGPRAADRARGLPARALLASLRRRVVPRARACFRADRRGRAAHDVRAVPVITLSDLEVTRVEIGGTIDESLRTCLEDAFQTLEVPPFEGTIVARWPLYTEARFSPPTLELELDLAARIDQLAPREEIEIHSRFH